MSRFLWVLIFLFACAPNAPVPWTTNTDARAVDVGAHILDATPSNRRYLIAILGQSNAEGIGDATDTTLDQTMLAPYPIVYNASVYDLPALPFGARGRADTGNSSYAVYNYGPLQPFWYNAAHQDFGFELTLGRDLEATLPGRVAMTKYAVGGSQLDTHWNPSGRFPPVGPNLSHLALAAVRDAYEACGCDRLVVVWEQGEQDAGHLADAEVYATSMAPLVGLFRVQWPDALWVIGRLNSDAVNSGKAPYTSTVQAQQAAYVAADPLSVLVDQDAYPLRADHLHYTDQAYLDLGHAFARDILPRI